MGRHITQNGYVRVTEGGTNESEHVLTAERALGRKLVFPEQVHHVDLFRRNNKNENLVICPDTSYHKLLHRRTAALNATGHADWLKCKMCKQWGAPDTMFYREYPSGIVCYHPHCNKERSQRIRDSK